MGTDIFYKRIKNKYLTYNKWEWTFTRKNEKKHLIYRMNN